MAGFLFLALLGVASCDEIKSRLFSPKVRVKCQVMEGRCKFTNDGDPGNSCVRVQVKHLESGRTLVSNPVCSGIIDRDSPVWVSIGWGKEDPLKLCMGNELKGDFRKACEAVVLEGEVDSPEK